MASDSAACRCGHAEREHKWEAAECGHSLCPCNKYDPPTDAAAQRIADLEALCVDYKRSYDRVCREHKALTEQVIAALSTPEHHHEMRGGMPFCSCWHSLRGDEGRALDVLIEHLLDVVRKERADA